MWKIYLPARISQDNHDGITMTAREVLRELSMIGRFDVANAFDEDGNLLHPTQMDLPTRLNVQSIEMTQAGDGNMKMHKMRFSGDKLAALEKLAKFHQLFEVEQGEQGVFRTYYKIPSDALV